METSAQSALSLFAKNLSKILGPEESGKNWRVTKDLDNNDVFLSLANGMRISLRNRPDPWHGIVAPRTSLSDAKSRCTYRSPISLRPMTWLTTTNPGGTEQWL